MRIRYIGMDKRTRVSKCISVKFLSDGFKSTDKKAEVDDTIIGPVLVVHLLRSKGGKRLILSVPASFDMESAKLQLLEKGWLDLSDCPIQIENLY